MMGGIPLLLLLEDLPSPQFRLAEAQTRVKTGCLVKVYRMEEYLEQCLDEVEDFPNPQALCSLFFALGAEIRPP